MSLGSEATSPSSAGQWVGGGHLVSKPISGVTAGNTVRVPSRAEQLVYGGEGRHLTWPDQEAQCKHEGSHLSRFSPSGSVCRALLAEEP